MFDSRHYTITMREIEHEGNSLFEGTVKALPDIAEYAGSREEAYALALDAITATVEMFKERDRLMPVPFQSA